MSDTPLNPFENPEEYEFFAFVVDGEVTLKIPLHNSFEGMIAAMSSDPKVIKLSSPEKLSVIDGWTYNGENFSPPAE